MLNRCFKSFTIQSIMLKEIQDSMPSLMRLTAMANQQVGVMNSEMSDLMSQISKDEK